MNGTFYKAPELIVSETVQNPVLSLTLDGAIIYVGRHNFGLVNLEIRIIEGQIIEVLLYMNMAVDLNTSNVSTGSGYQTYVTYYLIKLTMLVTY